MKVNETTSVRAKIGLSTQKRVTLFPSRRHFETYLEYMY
jgi:hypothetical protein